MLILFKSFAINRLQSALGKKFIINLNKLKTEVML